MFKKIIKVLLIENNTLDACIVQEMLAQEKNIKFKLVNCISKGLMHLAKGEIDVVLLNLALQKNNGINALSKIHTQAPQVAIVVQTILANKSTAVKTLQKGAQDYLIKDSLDSELLVRSLSYSVEKKNIENMLLESKEKFKKLSENILEWIWEIDNNGKYIFSSSIVEKIVGYNPKEIMKKYFYDLFHPDELEGMKKVMFKILSKKQSFKNFISQNIHKNGEIVWLSTSGWPIHDKKGNITGFGGINLDITKLKKLENRLHNFTKSKTRAENVKL